MFVLNNVKNRNPTGWIV